MSTYLIINMLSIQCWQGETFQPLTLFSGKTPEKDGQLGGALLSEVSTLFEMLMTQKADAHPGPRPDVLYRLSAAYRRSLGLDATATAGGSAPKNCSEKRPSVASKHQHQ